MRFASSALMAVSTTDGSVPVLRCDTVGSDSSPATKGSSTVIVAGKKRDPAKPWANAPAVGRIVSTVARASQARPSRLAANIGYSQIQREQAIGAIAPGAGARYVTDLWRDGAKLVPVERERRWRQSADAANHASKARKRHPIGGMRPV